MAVFTSHEPPPPCLKGSRVPVYAYPEEAVRALAKAADYGRWRERDPGAPPSFEDLRRDEAAATLADALGRGGGWLEPAAFACVSA